LESVVDDWEDNAYKHQPAHLNSQLEMTMEVNFIDVAYEQDQIDEVDSSSKVVNMFSIIVPVEVIEIFDDLGVEDAHLLAVLKAIHQVINFSTLPRII
jgi:hypothetical protein